MPGSIDSNGGAGCIAGYGPWGILVDVINAVITWAWGLGGQRLSPYWGEGEKVGWEGVVCAGGLDGARNAGRFTHNSLDEPGVSKVLEELRGQNTLGPTAGGGGRY